MFSNPVARASLGVLWLGMVVCYLGSWTVIWLFTHGLLILLGLAAAFAIFGRLGADIVALFAVYHLIKTLGASFRVLSS